LAELRLEEEKLLSKYNEQSIPVVNIRNEIEKAQQILDEERKTYLTNTIISQKQALQGLRSKEQIQKQENAKLQQELLKINNVEFKLKELERQVALNEENYQLYVRNMEEARISKAMDMEKIASVSVVEPALPPLQPIPSLKRIKILLSIILGGFLGLGTAFALEYFNQSFNKREDVVKHLGLPVLASIPEMKR